MNRTTTGMAFGLAAVGMTVGLLGSEIAQLQDWQPVLTPGFVGRSLMHLATVIAAYVSGQMVPTSDRFKKE